jgi:HSP20 family protein
MKSFTGETLKDLTSIQDRMNRLFSESLKRIKEMSEPEETKKWIPAVDVFEMPEAFVLLAEVPGIPKESLTVEFVDGMLLIRGERPAVAAVEGGSLYRSERHYGPFERTFNLPVSVSTEHIEARINDGVLMISIAKKEKEKRHIKVDIG